MTKKGLSIETFDALVCMVGPMLILVGAIVFGGCVSSVGATCEKDFQCGSGMRCRAGKCVVGNDAMDAQTGEDANQPMDAGVDGGGSMDAIADVGTGTDGTCDPLAANSCGGSGQKCTVIPGTSGGIGCAPAGETRRDQVCLSDSQCVARTTCANFLPNPSGRCVQFCRTDIDCGVGNPPSLCVLTVGPALACSTTCVIGGASCSNGDFCRSYVGGMAGNTVLTALCLPEGTVPLGEACTSPLQCMGTASCPSRPGGGQCAESCQPPNGSCSNPSERCQSNGLCGAPPPDAGADNFKNASELIPHNIVFPMSLP